MIDRPGLGTLIQARMGAKRLPNKVLMPIAGRPMLGRVLDRHRLMRNGGKLIVATSDLPADDVIESFCAAESVACFRGSEADVLGRFYHAAIHYHIEHVIRGTGDNPLMDPEVGDELVELYFSDQADYAVSKSVDVDSGLPDGMGLEVISFQALETAHRLGHQDHHREHINEYILERPDEFRISVLRKAIPEGSEAIRLTVDTREDLAFVEMIYAQHDGGASETLSLSSVLGIASDLQALQKIPKD